MNLTNLCRVCHQNSILGLNDLLFSPPICVNCLKKFKRIFKIYYINGVEHLFLYEYNDFVKELIYLYKGKYNKSLSDVFTYSEKMFLKLRYLGYTFLCAPSSIHDDIKRDFNHVEEIAKSISLKVIKPFYKISDWKQSSKNKEERAKIEKIIRIDYEKIKGLKKIVIIDDIYSTGSTINACIKLIKHKCKIKVLCICKNVAKNVELFG